MKRDCRGCFGASYNDCKDCNIPDVNYYDQCKESEKMKQKLVRATVDVPEKCLEPLRIYVAYLEGKYIKAEDIKETSQVNLRDHIDRVIEEVSSEMCRGICKYEAECEEAIINGKDYPCPLDRL